MKTVQSCTVKSKEDKWFTVGKEQILELIRTCSEVQSYRFYTAMMLCDNALFHQIVKATRI